MSYSTAKDESSSLNEAGKGLLSICFSFPPQRGRKSNLLFSLFSAAESRGWCPDGWRIPPRLCKRVLRAASGLYCLCAVNAIMPQGSPRVFLLLFFAYSHGFTRIFPSQGCNNVQFLVEKIGVFWAVHGRNGAGGRHSTLAARTYFKRRFALCWSLSSASARKRSCHFALTFGFVMVSGMDGPMCG